MIKGKQQRRFDRKRVQTGAPPTAPRVTVTSVTALAPASVRVEFSGPVMIGGNGLPTDWTFGTGERQILSITSGTGTTWTFLTNGTVAASQDYDIGGNDPAARTSSGGYVSSAAGTMV